MGAAWPRPALLPDEQEAGGQQKVGERCWPEVGSLRATLGLWVGRRGYV